MAKEVMTQVREILGNRHEWAKEWKQRTGCKVLGGICTYVPEEIVHAAGILPVRILGSHEPQSITDVYIFSMYCPFCRDMLAQGMTGRYDYLDGVVIARSCIHQINTYGAWKFALNPSYEHFVSMPANIQSPRAKTYLTEELRYFASSLEDWLGKRITDESLHESIQVYNNNRQLLRQIYELRKQDPPGISGTEVVELVVASQIMDKQEHAKLLEELLEELPSTENRPAPGRRLMVIGSELPIDFVGFIESLGANVVIEDDCTGSRYFWNDVPLEEDPIAAIATRYIERPPCPAKDWPHRSRIDHVMNLAKDYNVEGVILANYKFCDPHELDNPELQQSLEKADIPCLHLELDVTTPVGQFRTRVEAFLEMFELEIV